LQIVTVENFLMRLSLLTVAVDVGCGGGWIDHLAFLFFGTHCFFTVGNRLFAGIETANVVRWRAGTVSWVFQIGTSQLCGRNNAAAIVRSGSFRLPIDILAVIMLPYSFVKFTRFMLTPSLDAACVNLCLTVLSRLMHVL
jgi:hypothetical protein